MLHGIGLALPHQPRDDLIDLRGQQDIGLGAAVVHPKTGQAHAPRLGQLILPSRLDPGDGCLRRHR